MATALYRRYRPESFADVIGQEHVTEPLMQALRTGRVNHAYLFSGPRGCGKTTSARILARCLNCEQGPTPEPCGVCDSCVALARGGAGSVDVIEIDAASHGGVDDARDLRERASYGPAQSRFKIYIIDEAHMVTPQGFNALLKIVEEPPEHVKFIFATTEPEKVIGTIRSRTHHYPFRLVPPAKLTAYMERLLEHEHVAVQPGVLSFVTRAGGGSVRDSLSVLDQLIAGSGEQGLTYDGAVSLLGFTDGELLDATVDALAAGDGAATFRQLDRVIESGHDPRRFVEDLLERLRDLIVVAAVPEGAGQVLRGVPDDQLERMRVQQAAFGQGALSRAADIVNAGLTEMTGASSPRLQLELICARILLPASSGEQGYAARLDRLERRLDVGGVPSPAAGQGHPTSPPRMPVSPAPHGGAPGSPSGGQPGGAGAPGQDAGERGGHDGAVTAPRRTTTDFTPPHAAVTAGALSPEATRREATRDGAGTGEPTGDRRPGAGWSAPSGPGGPGSHRGDGGEQRPVSPEQAADIAAARAEVGAPPVAAPTESVGGPSLTDDDAAVHQAGATAPSGGGAAAASGGMDTDAIRRAWPDVLGRIFGMRRATWTFVSQHAQVLGYDGSVLTLGIGTVGLTNTFRSGNHAELVRQALIDELGVDARVDGVPLPDAGSGDPDLGPGSPSGDFGDRSGSSGVGGPAGGSSAPTDGGGGHAGTGRGADAPGAGPSTWSAPDAAQNPGMTAPRAGAAPTRDQGAPSNGGGNVSGGGSRAEQPTRSLQTNAGWGSTSGPAPDWATAPPAGPSGPSASPSRSAPPSAPSTSGGAAMSAPPAAPTRAPVGSGDGAEDQPTDGAGRPSPTVKAATTRSGVSAVRESFAQARKAGAGAGPSAPASEAAAPPEARGDDSAVSDDDEDIEVSGDVGRSVVERVFGGRVLSDSAE
ncbi:DNA polymerase III subunit gamma and tau [Terracoccus luteus]|uniref:DNA-directed DNA polymerase n=1 Tax=Terracoccus luteus TaxID=53356 RepID=A0A839PQ16_9MICO|nr:DNA polymerase III subunit gamma and tau [Terracoccus luteus]MBB2986398.1 DNA polymerase-3 subunit gamma/tau [Terracoccus luteus]MCP2172012.1 DNA polymerase-3 subunit gamma/tau [Terracoccus luteus]